MISFDVRRKNDHVVVEIGGELDMDAVLQIEPKLEEAMEVEGVQSLTIDLSGLAFIDSTGIGLILNTFEQCRAKGIEVRIFKPEWHVFHVFEVAGLADVLPFSDEAPAA